MTHTSRLLVISFTLLCAVPALGDELGPSDPPAAVANVDELRPFKIHVDDSVLRDLSDRLARTRLPDTIDNGNWDYGPSIDTMKGIIEYWRTKYDWRKQEERINQFNQFVTKIDGLDIHFIHERSKEAHALPLVIIHGWPGSFVEFTKIIGPLTDPVAHGGKSEDAFDVVC